MKCKRCKKRECESGKNYCRTCREYNQTAARQRRKRLKEGGVCQKCGKPRAFGKTICSECQSNTGVYNELRNEERLSRGLCVKCGKNPHESGVTRCKTCKDRDNETNYRRRYGITREQVQQMLVDQNNICLICENDFGDKFKVDHCHDSGRVRGLLCNDCNLFLGRYEAKRHLLNRIEDYLKE